jgi:hypothetical protein
VGVLFSAAVWFQFLLGRRSMDAAFRQELADAVVRCRQRRCAASHELPRLDFRANRPQSSMSAATWPPDEIRAHSVIPNHAQQRASEPSNPPSSICLVEPGSGVNVGDRTDTAG